MPFLGGGKKSAGKTAGAVNAAASGKTPSAEDAQAFKENLMQLEQRTGQVMSGLAGIGLEVTVLENDALIELFYNFYNPQTVERENITVPGSDAATAK